MTVLGFRAVVFATLMGVGCSIGDPTPPVTPPPVTPPPVTPPPVGDPPPPAPAVYKRASMPPVYQLTPVGEYTRFTIGQLGAQVTLADADFQLLGGGFANNAASKMDEIKAQLSAEAGGTAVPDIIKFEDRDRSQLIPFRGNPSDVDLITLANGVKKAYSPLGGDLMTPGNEVAAINLDANNTRKLIKVGIHPVRTAVHPAGLVFVCNQYSNYISVIDPERDELLKVNGKEVEIKTEFYCSDLVFVPRSTAAPDDDEQDLYVANNWRGSVLKYSIDIVRDNLSGKITDVQRIDPPVAPAAESAPTKAIEGCGLNPYRLSLSVDQRSIFVVGNRGGELGKLDIGTGTCQRTAVLGPLPDVAQAGDILVAATTTIDRGYPAQEEGNRLPAKLQVPEFKSTGIDGNQHVTHPAGLLDSTKATNFEDLRNGLLTFDAQRLSSPQYYTDDISAEENFANQQKILKGSLPQAIVATANGKKVFVAMSGSDVVQQFDVVGGQFRLKAGATPLFQTSARPYALALDDAANPTKLFVATWGGETLEVFDINTAVRSAQIDLGYANLQNAAAKYPATTLERGEFLFYNTAWSNNGRKSCATCHTEELLVDGIPYANGATTPGWGHKIPANFNLATTDSYFWNGSFGNGSYAALASDFQTRSNCELIAFGYIEGITSDETQRVGDPANKHTLGAAGDQLCRPQVVAGKVLPANFDTIVNQINLTKAVRDAEIKKATANIVAGGLDFAQVARATDFYGVMELRIPPNPVAFLAQNAALDTGTAAKLTRGAELYVSAGCNSCHKRDNTRAPFTDGLNHGNGRNWAQGFIQKYSQDPRVLDIIEDANLPRALPFNMTQAVGAHPNGTPDREINVHNGLDWFIPGCFSVDDCLVFDDPGIVRGTAAEDERLEVITKVNLANADRGYVPGNVTDQPQANTPSIRGNWWGRNFLRHGAAHNLAEAILGPGHPLLKTGEVGWAIDALGNLDVHGNTSTMNAADFEALTLYVQSIE